MLEPVREESAKGVGDFLDWAQNTPGAQLAAS
jgi:hypothetical protein